MAQGNVAQRWRAFAAHFHRLSDWSPIIVHRSQSVTNQFRTLRFRNGIIWSHVYHLNVSLWSRVVLRECHARIQYIVRPTTSLALTFQKTVSPSAGTFAASECGTTPRCVVKTSSNGCFLFDALTQPTVSRTFRCTRRLTAAGCVCGTRCWLRPPWNGSPASRRPQRCAVNIQRHDPAVDHPRRGSDIVEPYWNFVATLSSSSSCTLTRWKPVSAFCPAAAAVAWSLVSSNWAKVTWRVVGLMTCRSISTLLFNDATIVGWKRPSCCSSWRETEFLIRCQQKL